MASGGNSGVIYRVNEPGQLAYHTGPEYQIFDDNSVPNELSPFHSAGAIYGLYAAEQKSLCATGEYNSAKIIAHGNHIEHWLNGDRVAECEINSQAWRQKIAGSKFHAWPQFGTFPEGHTVLQSHGSPVWYGNLQIKILPANKDKP